MGTSESKVAVATPKLEPPSRPVRNKHLQSVIDPRSPSAGIDRTPIQVGAVSSLTPVRGGLSEGAVLEDDPRSPTLGISRTPMKDIMAATVTSFVRRLNDLFLDEEGRAEEGAPKTVPRDPYPGVQDEPFVAPPALSETPQLDSPGAVPQNLQAGAQVCREPSRFGCGSPAKDVPRFQTPLLPGSLGIDAGVLQTSHVLNSPEPDKMENPEPMGEPAGPEIGELMECGGRETKDGVPREGNESSESGCEQPQSQEMGLHLESCPPFGSGLQQSVPQNGEEEAPPLPSSTSPRNATVSGAEPQSCETEPHLASQRPDNSGVGSDVAKAEGGKPAGCQDGHLALRPQWLRSGFGVTGKGVPPESHRAVPQDSNRTPDRATAGHRGAKHAGSGVKDRASRCKKEKTTKVLLGEGRSPLQILKETNSPRERPLQMKKQPPLLVREGRVTPDRHSQAATLNKENRMR
ncbi:cell division cycle-associated protein 3 [Lepisosteus oculatus]|uniref:cell division cycle-associated protein 3 n=1 Tax=Lepisosteus oculatus TaxID=7918 RepID=UPI0037133FE4